MTCRQQRRQQDGVILAVVIAVRGDRLRVMPLEAADAQQHIDVADMGGNPFAQQPRLGPPVGGALGDLVGECLDLGRHRHLRSIEAAEQGADLLPVLEVGGDEHRRVVQWRHGMLPRVERDVARGEAIDGLAVLYAHIQRNAAHLRLQGHAGRHNEAHLGEIPGQIGIDDGGTDLAGEVGPDEVAPLGQRHGVARRHIGEHDGLDALVAELDGIGGPRRQSLLDLIRCNRQPSSVCLAGLGADHLQGLQRGAESQRDLRVAACGRVGGDLELKLRDCLAGAVGLVHCSGHHAGHPRRHLGLRPAGSGRHQHRTAKGCRPKPGRPDCPD